MSHRGNACLAGNAGEEDRDEVQHTVPLHRPAPVAGRRAQAWIVGATVLLATAAIYTSSLVFERQDAVQRVSRTNFSWSSSQAAQEVSRLQAAVGAFVVSRGEVEREGVELWLDIVANRVSTLQSGESGIFVHRNPEVGAIVGELVAAVGAARPLVSSLDDRDNALQIMQSLQRLNPRMARLASLAYAYDADRSAEDTQELGRLHWQFSGLLMGLIVSCLTLAGIAARRNR